MQELEEAKKGMQSVLDHAEAERLAAAQELRDAHGQARQALDTEVCPLKL